MPKAELRLTRFGRPVAAHPYRPIAELLVVTSWVPPTRTSVSLARPAPRSATCSATEPAPPACAPRQNASSGLPQQYGVNQDVVGALAMAESGGSHVAAAATAASELYDVPRYDGSSRALE